MRKKNLKNYAGILTLSAILGIGAIANPVNVKAATEHWNDASTSGYTWTQYKNNWETIRNNWENVSLTPGANETELNFAWYSRSAEKPKVRISTDKSMDNATIYKGTQTITNVTNADNEKYFSNKVTVKDLNERTTYYYQVYQNGKWQETKTYKTKSFSEFSFLYVGDPQIGACKKQTNNDGEYMDTQSPYLAARNDSFN